MGCPNLLDENILQEFLELKSIVGERLAYLIYDKRNSFFRTNENGLINEEFIERNKSFSNQRDTILSMAIEELENIDSAYIEKIKDSINEIDVNANTKENIKPGVSELFESNPELANQVYEALGFGQERSLPTSSETINIYAGDNQNAELSNFAIRPFTTNVETPSGEKQYTFQSVEQGFHFYKALVANNSQIAKQILSTTNGGQLKKITNRSNLPMTSEQVKEWNDASKSIMLNLMYDSYEQNPKAAEKLLATGNAKITHTQDNTRWKTDFPEVVMTVRDMLKEEGFDTQSQITPQQKQQAQQRYSQYLEQNPNGDIEGFKEFVQGKSNSVKSGVEELFSENPELANKVYSALGFEEENIIGITPKANIPQNLVSGVRSFGLKQEANSEAKELLGDNPHSIDMIEAGLRTRTTRSVGEMQKYNVKVGDIVKQFGKSADGTTKNILTRITAIHPKGSPEFLNTWEKEGWTADGVKEIERFKDGAAAIEFEIVHSNQITPEQKATAQQVYSRYIDSLNKPNTNPILQTNQEEQVKKFTELQERLNNKEFLEGAKFAYENSEELKSFGTQEKYNDYIARVSLGIIKNPSSGEYNYESKVRDIVYHGGTVQDIFKKENIGKSTTNSSKNDFGQPNAFYFTTSKESSKTYGDVKQIILNVKNPAILEQSLEDNGFGFRRKNKFTDVQKLDLKNKDGFILKDIFDAKFLETLSTKDLIEDQKGIKQKELDKKIEAQHGDTIGVFEPEQIHILGSKADTQGFKEFVSKGNKLLQESGSLATISKSKIDNLQSTIEYQLLNEKDEDLDKKVGQSYMFLSEKDAERFTYLVEKNKEFPKEFKVTKKITKYERDPKNPLKFNGYNEYVDFYYIKSNKNKKSNLYDIVNKETGEIIASKVRVLAVSKDVKSEIASKYGLEYTPTKIFSANRSVAFALYRQKPSKAKYIAQAKKYLYDAIKFLNPEETNLKINLDKIEELFNSFPEEMWDYINTTYSPEDSTKINASISLQNEIKFKLPKLGFIQEIEKITGLKLLGTSFTNYDRSGSLAKVFKYSKINGKWGDTITIDNSMTTRELEASIVYYLKQKNYFKPTSEEENVRKYAEHNGIDYSELKELVFGDIDKALNNINYNNTGNSDTIELSKWRESIRNYNWQSVELFYKPYENFQNTVKERIITKFKDKKLSNGISHLEYFFNSGAFNWLNINFNNISGQYYMADMETEAGVGVKTKTVGIVNPFEMKVYQKPKAGENFLEEKEVFNRLAAILHEPFHALHALSYGTKEELELRKAFDNLYNTDFGKEMMNRVFGTGYNQGQQVSYDTLYKEFTAFTTQLMLYPKQWIQNTDLRSNDIYEFIEKIQTLQDKTYEEIVKTQQKVGTVEKTITEEEQIKLSFLEKLYNYLVKALNQILPISKKFTKLIADSKLVEKKVIEDVFGEVEERVTKTLKLPENVKKSKEQFLQTMEELQSAINTLMQIDSKLFSSENITNFFTSNQYNQESSKQNTEGFKEFVAENSNGKVNLNISQKEVDDLIPNSSAQLEIDFGQNYNAKNIQKTHNLFLEDKGFITTEEYEKLPYKDNGLTKTFYANSESDADYWVSKYGAIKVKLFGKDVGKYKMVIKKPFEIDDLPSSVEKLPKEIEETINRKKNVIQALKLKISKDNSRTNELKSKINLLNSRINKIKEKYKSDDFKLYEIAYEDVKLISENLKSFEKNLENSNLTSNELRIIVYKLVEVSYDIKGWIDVHNLVSEKYFGTEKDIANITGAIKMLDSKYKKILTNVFVRFAKLNTIYTELSEEDLIKAVADISIYNANVHTIGKSDIKLLKIVDDLLNNTATDINLEYQNKKIIINNQLKKAIDKLKISRNDLKEFFKQKRSDGTWTGNIIGEFKQEFYDKQSELIEEAKISKNWRKYFKWLNENSTSFTSKELVEISKMDEESITEIGRFSKKEVLQQKKLINDYRSFYMASVELLGKLDKYIDGELIINENESNEGISVEFKHDDAKIVDNFYYEIDSIIKENSPFEYLSNKEKKVNSKIKNIGYYYIIRNKPNENWEDLRFKEIKENETLMETYNMIMNTLNENNKYLPILNEYQSNYMPELAKPLLQRISNNGLIGMFGGLKNEIINSITEEVNSSEEIRPIIGSQTLEPIPIKMMSNNIITENKEDDIFKVLIEHSKMAISYKYKSQIEPLANASLDLIDFINEVSLKTTKAGSEYVTKFGKIKEREGGLVNAKKALKFRIESFLNNKSKDVEGVTKIKKKVKNLKGEVVEKNISLSKILDFLLGITYAKQLGAPNVISPTVNLAYGLVSNLSYAAGGAYVSEKNLIKSFIDLQSIAIGVNSKSEKTEKILTFIDSFGIFGNLYDTEVGDNGFIQKITFLQQKAELINQGSLVLAILKTIKLKDKNGNDISIYDAYTMDNGHLKWDTTKMEVQELLGNDVVYNKEKTQINFKTLSSLINDIVGEVHGDYKNPMMIKKTVLMRAVMQYKRFIPNAVKHRFGKEYENMNLIDEKTGKRGALVKGRYLSYINSKIFDKNLNQYIDAKFGDIVKILISGLLFNKKNIQQLKEIDRINMMRNIRELHFILLSMAAIMALESLINDDDDNDFMVKILINSISKTQSDMMFFLNPSAMSQITNNFIPVLSTIKDMQNLVYSSFKMLYGDIYYENGPWKDYSRLGVSTMKLFPGTNGAVKMFNYGSRVFEFN